MWDGQRREIRDWEAFWGRCPNGQPWPRRITANTKSPTLRNVDKRPGNGFLKVYLHNGVFTSVEEVVHSYNTRDVEDWPPPIFFLTEVFFFLTKAWDRCYSGGYRINRLGTLLSAPPATDGLRLGDQATFDVSPKDTQVQG